MYVYNPDIPIYRFSGLYINSPQGIGTLVDSLISLGRMQRISAAVAIHTVPIYIPPGTHYCWVDRGGAD